MIEFKIFGKEILISIINEWRQFFYKHEFNWREYNFALLQIYYENDMKVTGGLEFMVIVLGFGIRLRINLDWENSEAGENLKDIDLDK